MEQITAEGDTAYREGDYDAALEAYHLALENGYSSGPLLYNIANAYYKRGELGPAILFYERAARKMPHDRDVRYNLSLARSRAVDKIEPPPRLPVWDWLDTLRDLVPPGLLAMLALAAAVVGSLFFGVAYLIRNRRPRRFLYSCSISVSVVFLLLIGLLFLRISADHGPPRAVVLAEKVVVRSAPDKAAQEIFHLHEGTGVTLLKQLPEWYEIRLVDGRQGWMPSGACETI